MVLVKRNANKRAYDVKNNGICDINISYCYGALCYRMDRRENDDFTTKCTVRAAILKILSAE